MLRSTNRPPVDDTGRRPEGKEPTGENINTGRQALLELIPAGAGNGIGAGELARLLGVSDSRTIRQMVAEARRSGAVILAGALGYFQPSPGQQGRDEANAWLAAITAKGISTLRAGDSARAWLAVLPGQERIGGGTDGGQH